MIQSNQQQKDPLQAEPKDQEEIIIEQTLRPQSLEEYVGQTGIKNNLNIIIQAAKQRGEILEDRKSVV
jgi:Holliday junction DNA helicase RuvB